MSWNNILFWVKNLFTFGKYWKLEVAQAQQIVKQAEKIIKSPVYVPLRTYEYENDGFVAEIARISQKDEFRFFMYRFENRILQGLRGKSPDELMRYSGALEMLDELKMEFLRFNQLHMEKAGIANEI